MANKLTLQHKRSSVAGNQPTAAQIAVGELAINFADQKLYTKTAAGTIIPLGAASTDVRSQSGATAPTTRADGTTLADGDTWYDTTANVLMVRESGAWVKVAAGDVAGPASSVDNTVVRYNGTTGKLIQGSSVVIDDLNNITGVVDLTTTGNTIFGDTAADTMTFNGSTLAIPNNLNIDTNTLMINANTNRVGFGTALPAARVDVNGTSAHNVVALATNALDLNQGQMFTRTVTAAANWSFANVPAGRGSTVVLHLTDGGVAAQTWPAVVKWPNGMSPTLTLAGTDVLVFVTHDGGTTWRGNVFGKDIK